MQAPTSILNNGSGTDGTLFTSASITPTGGTTLALFVSQGCATGGNNGIPTIAGTLGLTWTQQLTQVNTGSNNLRGTWFTAPVPTSPPTGTITMTFANTQSSCQWEVQQIVGANNADPVRQAIAAYKGTTTNPTVTLASSPLAENLLLGASVRNLTTAYTAGTNFTLLSSMLGHSGPACGQDIEYDTSPSSTTVGWTTASSSQKCVYAMEINVAPALNNFFALL